MSVIINGTAGVTFPDSVLQTSGVPGPGSSGNALISNGTIWVSQAISTTPFVTGTAMLFKQTAAPTGWTKVTTDDNKALRVVSGTASTGGSVAFTTAFASQAVAGSIGNTTATGTVGTSGATTLSTGEMPSHTHTISSVPTLYIGGIGPNCGPGTASNGSGATYTSNSTGGGGSHTHSGGTFTGTAHNHSFTGTAINLAVQYVDVIVATIN